MTGIDILNREHCRNEEIFVPRKIDWQEHNQKKNHAHIKMSRGNLQNH